jgi:hypothetical protein
MPNADLIWLFRQIFEAILMAAAGWVGWAIGKLLVKWIVGTE